MKKNLFFSFLILLAGCASLGDPPLDTPPEFNQTVMLAVDDNYRDFQATLSGYDIGDLQNFHSQHTLPILVEDAFKEIFGKVDKYEPGEPSIGLDEPDVPAIFEVKFLDLANDIYNEADNYRAQATLAVAMRNPKGNVAWQKAFRANGYVRVDNQHSLPLGPQDAVVAAVRDAIDQMQRAIINSPEVRNQLKYYKKAMELKRRDQTSGNISASPSSAG